MLDRGAVDDRDAGFRTLEREGAETGAFSPAHDTHLHTPVLVLKRFNSDVIDARTFPGSAVCKRKYEAGYNFSTTANARTNGSPAGTPKEAQKTFLDKNEIDIRSSIMGQDTPRELVVERGTVQCLPDKREDLDHCRFCIHCREFRVKGAWVKSPSLAYCTKCRVTEEVDLQRVESVKCADRQSEGFHSIASIIG